LPNDDIKEKRNIGEFWQGKSSGKYLSLLLSKEGLKQQIVDKKKRNKNADKYFISGNNQ
jgi:hypothetical protein